MNYAHYSLNSPVRSGKEDAVHLVQEKRTGKRGHFGKNFQFFEDYEQFHQTDEGSTLAARVFSRGSCFRMLFFTLLHSDKILPHVHNDFV